MKILIHHIENLLPEHDCVVVPGLGGFVQSETQARLSEDGILYPGRKEICFNPRLKFNDGLLAQSYQEIHDLTFEEANQQIQQAVREIHSKLEEGKYLRIGHIGTLSRKDQQLQFQPDSKNHFHPEAFGLTAFAFPKLVTAAPAQEPQQKAEKAARSERITKRREAKQRVPEAEVAPRENHRDDYFHLTFHKESVRQLLVAAAVFLFFIFLSKPTGGLQGESQEASLLLHNTFAPAPTPTAAAPTADTSTPTAPTAKTTATTRPEDRVFTQTRPESTVTGMIQETIDVLKKTFAGAKSESTPTSYYLVIGSYSRRETAERWLSMHADDPALQGASVILLNGWARVIVKRFSTSNDANAFFDTFTKEHPAYSNAFIYSSEGR
jgi:nucleoid DNA-binding protein